MPSLPGVTDLVDRLFCASHTAIYGPYRRLGEGTVLLPDLLYRYRVLDTSEVPATLQVFTGIGRMGGQLWEQEMRVLLRISAVGHPALPRIIDGSYDEESDIAFVVTEAAEHTLAAPEALPFLRSRLADCVRHLGLLADALAVLHGQGLMHRNLWPGSIDVVEDGRESGKLRLRLARFEMSALVSNLLRRVSPDVRQGDEDVRRLFLGQGPHALAYFPPERLAFLFADSRADMVETDRSDVYGLGVMAWEWFVGPLPDDRIPKQAGAENGVPAWTADLRSHMASEITRSKLPARLQDLLRGMLDPDPRTRLTSAQVAEEITRRYDAFVAPWESPPTGLPHLVAFMPRESRTTVHAWEWIDRDPAEPDGRVELAEFLESELRGAELVYSPEGADPYVQGSDREKKRQARYVLLGRRGSWFCVPYEDRTPFGGGNEVLEEVLLIKYVAKRLGTRPLDSLPFRRRISSVDVVPWDVGHQALDDRRRNRPSWTPILETVRVAPPKPPWHADYERAFDWFLDQQEVELLARRYPFIRCSDTGGTQQVRLKFDKERDRKQIDSHRTALFALFASSPSRRPSFGDFFDSLESGDVPAVLEFFADDDGRPNWDRRGDAFMARRLDDDHIVIRRASGSPPVPEKGWLRPKEDFGTERSLSRQREARPEFLEARSLLAQLHDPSTIRGFRHRWREAGKGLRGGADDVVKDMLVSQVFYALHGPPGTGKTTVAAHAVEAYLRSERSARILVSAQSNYALDNLALRIRKQLAERGVDVLAIRVASPSGEEKVDPRLDDWRLEKLVPRLAGRIASRCSQRLDRRMDPEPLRPVLGRWKAAVETSYLELQDRIRRGANLVFATCSAATKRNVDAVGSFGVYDWVIVEEAAKAWPTELAIPLVRGVRWTLIGDHKQLPAHRRREVDDLLAECAQSDDLDLQQHGQSRAAYGEVFDLFRTLFDRESARLARGGARRPRGGLVVPLGRLTRQFRMRRPIAEVVSRAFYPSDEEPDSSGLPKGTLQTDETTEVDAGLREPNALVGRALVWLDTEGVEDCQDEPRWANRGEARIVCELLKTMKPSPWLPASGAEPLALLSPYRDQIDVLAQTVLPGDCASRLFSVHEFQGREADFVVASLVRDKVRGVEPRSNLGHLVQPELVNVLLSRARRLLVVVGRFRHFHESGVPFWHVVCETVRREGQVVPAGSVVRFGEGAR